MHERGEAALFQYIEELYVVRELGTSVYSEF